MNRNFKKKRLQQPTNLINTSVNRDSYKNIANIGNLYDFFLPSQNFNEQPASMSYNNGQVNHGSQGFISQSHQDYGRNNLFMNQNPSDNSYNQCNGNIKYFSNWQYNNNSFQNMLQGSSDHLQKSNQGFGSASCLQVTNQLSTYDKQVDEFLKNSNSLEKDQELMFQSKNDQKIYDQISDFKRLNSLQSNKYSNKKNSEPSKKTTNLIQSKFFKYSPNSISHDYSAKSGFTQKELDKIVSINNDLNLTNHKNYWSPPCQENHTLRDKEIASAEPYGHRPRSYNSSSLIRTPPRSKNKRQTPPKWYGEHSYKSSRSKNKTSPRSPRVFKYRDHSVTRSIESKSSSNSPPRRLSKTYSSSQYIDNKITRKSVSNSPNYFDHIPSRNRSSTKRPRSKSPVYSSRQSTHESQLKSFSREFRKNISYREFNRRSHSHDSCDEDKFVHKDPSFSVHSRLGKKLSVLESNDSNFDHYSSMSLQRENKIMCDMSKSQVIPIDELSKSNKKQNFDQSPEDYSSQTDGDDLRLHLLRLKEQKIEQKLKILAKKQEMTDRMISKFGKRI